MKNRLLWGFFIFLFGVMTWEPPLQAKEYTIPQINVDVQVNADGTVYITEEHTFAFDGEFSQAFYSIPKSGYSAIRNIQVLEGDDAFTNLNSEETGTFLVEESEDTYTIRWFYNAEDEERTFTISYLLEGAFTIGPEWSQFFWNYTSDERDKNTGTLNIAINLPNEVDAKNLHSWIRHPRGQIISLPVDNGFSFTGTDISKNQQVSIRTVFPTSVFDQSRISTTDSDFSLAWAEEDEMAYRKEQRRKSAEEARLYQLGIEVSVILAGLSILAFVFLYRKYGTRHSVNLSVRKSIMIPGKEKPALIGWLLSGRNVMHNHLMATLMDLARRGYFKIEQREPDEEDESWLSKDNDEPIFIVTSTDKSPEEPMTDWERSLFEYVRAKNADGKEKMDEVFKGTSTEFAKWFQNWKKQVHDVGSNRGWIDTESYKGLYWNIAIQAVLVVAAILAMIYTHPVLLTAAFVILLMILLSMVIVRRTPKGEELYRRWIAYRDAVKDAKSHNISKEELGLHFIYSVALGVNSQEVEQLFEQYPEASTAIYWIVLLPDMQQSPGEIASSFSALAATGNASASGGFSGGGASAGAAGGGAASGAS